MKKLSLQHISLLLICFFQFACITGQNLGLKTPLPANKDIKKGVLPNGLTYYLYATDVTQDVASYYIIQDVGSVLENDNQRGLAHFLEHMAFNGTENFEGKGILNTLQKEGAVFGRDINAYTSFDETVYNMNNIPTTQELINTCLLVLHDWANGLLLTEEEIDAERGVIKEEWRSRQSGGMRLLKKSLPVMFNNAIYAQRMPIGKMDVIENFEYKDLRDFYHDWYRTDLQAIAVVGDIDLVAMEEKIKALFSEIPAVENPKERFIVEVADNKEMLFNLGLDDEVSTANINFSINHPRSLEDQTVGDFRTSLLRSMVTSMLTARMSEISQQPEAPFLRAGVGFGSLARSKDRFSLTVVPKPGKDQEAFEAALEEVNRVVKHGFTHGEIDRTISKFLSFYENKLATTDEISHAVIINAVKENFLENKTMLSYSDAYFYAKEFFAEIDEKELHEIMKNLYTQENRVLNVTGVKDQPNLSRENAIALIQRVENAELEAYFDEFGDSGLTDGIDFKPGNIVTEKEDKVTGATVFSLSNGAKVYHKFVDKNKNAVRLWATSYGGKSLLDDSELPSADFLGTLVQLSGLGAYSASELKKVMAGKNASTRVSLGGTSESISGSSVTKDVETLLQQVYLRFEEPRFEEEAYEVLTSNLNNALLSRSKDLGGQMQDSLTTTLYGSNNPRRRILTEEFVKEVNIETIEDIYKERFSNASDFTFFIVGDVKKEDLKPLLEKYVASLSTTNEKENWIENSVSWTSNTIDEDIFLKMEDPKAAVNIGFKTDIKYSLRNNMLAQTLADILTLRFTQTLREEEGGTYGASTQAFVSKRPVQQVNLSIRFESNPEQVENLISTVYEELRKVAQGDVQQVDLDKTLTNFLKRRTEQKNYNSYDMSQLTNYVLEGYDMNDPKNHEEIIGSIKVEDVQEFAKNLLEKAKTYEVVFKPTTP